MALISLLVVASALCSGAAVETPHSLKLTIDDRRLLIEYAAKRASSEGNRTELRDAIEKVYDHFAATFDNSTFQKAYEFHRLGAMSYGRGGERHRYVPVGPHCDFAATEPRVVQAVTGPGAQYPGGILQRVSGFSFAKFISGLTKADGAGGASVGQAEALAAGGLSMGAGLVQSLAATVLSAVPPLIPPPAWNNMPLPCVPMVTGHHCFGAVLHPITMSDFVIADVTDSMMAGQIAAFPSLYASKVGKTTDAAYKLCYAAYMSMMCSSIFPRCTSPQSSDDLMPAGGRVPMCFYLCINTLVSCPGLWMDDIHGPCSLISVPPMCTQAFYWKVFTAPPQYEDFSQAKGFPKDCPEMVEPELASPAATIDSPIERAAAELDASLKQAS